MPGAGSPRGGPGARLTDEAKARICKQVSEGVTVEKVALAVGWSSRTIRREARRDRQFWDALTEAMATGAAVRQRARRNARIAS